MVASRLQRRAQTINPNTAGGFLVPQDVQKRFWSEVLDDQLLQAITIYEEPSGTSSDIVIDNDLTLGTWEGEGAAVVPTDFAFASVGTATMPKVVTAVTSSWELLQDGVITDTGETAAQILDARMVRRLRNTIHNAICTGTGVGQPTGLFNAAANLPVIIPGPITQANLATLFSSIYDYHLTQPSCAWVMGGTTFIQVLNLGLPSGWLNSDSYPMRMLGLPVILTPFSPQNEIVFGDLAWYALKRIPGFFAGVDGQTLALSGREIRFTWTRMDGKPVVAANRIPNLGILRPV